MRGACRGNDDPCQVKGCSIKHGDAPNSGRGWLKWLYNTHLQEVDGRLDGLESDDVAIHYAIRMVLNELKESHAKYLEELQGQFMAEVGRIRDVYERQLNSALI